LGIGDWGLGIGDWGLGPVPNPQSPYEKLILNICMLLYKNNNNNLKIKINLKNIKK